MDPIPGKGALRQKFRYSQLFWSVFSRIRTEYREKLRISPYSVRMRKNTDQNNSEYGHFSRSEGCRRQPVKIFIGAFMILVSATMMMIIIMMNFMIFHRLLKPLVVLHTDIIKLCG